MTSEHKQRVLIVLDSFIWTLAICDVCYLCLSILVK